MQKTLALLLLLAWPALAPAARAEQLGRPLGRLYLSFGSGTYISQRTAYPLVLFSVYLVADVDYFQLGMYGQHTRNGIASWETAVVLPAPVTVLSRTLLLPSAVDTGVGDDNWIVGLGEPLIASETPRAIVQYDLILLGAQNDLAATLAPPQPSRLADQFGLPAAPAWMEWADSGECGEPCLRPFVAPWEQTSVLINCTQWWCTHECFYWPPVTIRRPTAGEVMRAGDTLRIEWEPSAEAEASSIGFTQDGGLSWETIASFSQDLGFYDWLVPDAPTHQAWIQIDSNCGNPAGPFTILPRTVASDAHSWGSLKAMFR